MDYGFVTFLAALTARSMSARAFACSGVPSHVSRNASISSGLVAGSVELMLLGACSAYLHNLAKALLLRFGHRSKTLEIVACDTPESFAIDTCDVPLAPNTSL